MADTATALIPVTFHGATLYTATLEGRPFVPLRPISEALGLDWQSQIKRIRRHDVMSKGVVMMTTPSAGGPQKGLAMPLTMLNGWLFGVDVGRVKPELRDRLVQYQRECFDVLAAHFGAASAHAPYSVDPTQTLSAAQADELRQMLAAGAQKLPTKERGPFMVQGWSKLKAHFGVMYRKIPGAQFSDALSIVSRHCIEHARPAVATVPQRWLLEVGPNGAPVTRAIPADAEILTWDDVEGAVSERRIDPARMARLAVAAARALFGQVSAARPSTMADAVERALISGQLAPAEVHQIAIAAVGRMLADSPAAIPA